MSLALIGVGFGRTGTDSTRVALNTLGFPCYHMREIIDNPANRQQHLAFWQRVAAAPPGTTHPWHEVFADYRAAVDNPAACVWRELLAAYPGAKVLLTLHPGGPDAWYDSTVETIYFTENRWQWKVLEATVPVAQRFGAMVRTLVWERFLRGSMPDRAAAIARYKAHIEEVKAAVPAERLLIFQVDQGWVPLCAFLGVPVPNDAFPRVNDRASLRKSMRAITAGAYAVLAIGALAVAALAGGLYYWLT